MTDTITTTQRVPQEALNQWADTAMWTNAALVKAQRAVADLQLQQTLIEAQERNATAWKSMERHVAHDPVAARNQALGRPAPVAKMLPLHLLDTPANRRYAARLREAYEALCEVEAERGIQDGASESMAETLASVEQEVFGAVGTCGME